MFSAFWWIWTIFVSAWRKRSHTKESQIAVSSPLARKFIERCNVGGTVLCWQMRSVGRTTGLTEFRSIFRTETRQTKLTTPRNASLKVGIAIPQKVGIAIPQKVGIAIPQKSESQGSKNWREISQNSSNFARRDGWTSLSAGGL